jgi:hypothetical protein
MTEEIKQLVKESVHQELLNETKALRYTKRFRNYYLTTQQPPLVEKIEKTVEDKIHLLKTELDALRTAGLKKVPQRRKQTNSSADSGEEDEEKNDGNIRDKEFDMKVITDEVKRSVQSALKEYLASGGPTNDLEINNGVSRGYEQGEERLPEVSHPASNNSFQFHKLGSIDTKENSYQDESGNRGNLPHKLDPVEPVHDEAHRNKDKAALGKPHLIVASNTSGNSNSIIPSNSDIGATGAGAMRVSSGLTIAAEIGVEETNYRTLMSNLLNIADVKVRDKGFLSLHLLLFV